MKPSLNRLPSPALVIACVALFVSLGGVSYGLAKGSIDSREIKNNTIRSKDVRNNTLRTFDIRNNEVRGFDIRNSTVRGRDVAFDTLSGQDISEATLAKVPSATTADTAASATTAGSVATLKTIGPTAVAEGAAAVTLATHGPLTLTGACEAAGANTDAVLNVQSTEANSAAGSSDAAAPPAGPTPVFGPGNAVVADFSDLAAAPRSVDSFAVFASAPSGKALTGQIAVHADAAAGSCLFHGHVALEG